MKLRALTVWQPWASLIMAGVKPYEFRKHRCASWAYGHRIVIHAGVRPIRRTEIADLLCRLSNPAEGWTTGLNDGAGPILALALERPERFPLGAGLGTVFLGKPVRAAHLFSHVADSDRTDQHTYGWPVSDPRPFAPFVPMTGHQGFWWWPEELPDA